jgi:hypothetical protein
MTTALCTSALLPDPSRSTASSFKLLLLLGRSRIAPPSTRRQGSNTANILIHLLAIVPGPKDIVFSCAVHEVRVGVVVIVL